MKRQKRLWAGNTFVVYPQIKCPCGNNATHFLEMHAVDMCTPERPTVGSFRCKECLDRDVRRAERIVLDRAEWCSSCGLTIDGLSSIIVRQCSITERG